MSRTAAPRITIATLIHERISGTITVEAENLPGIRVVGEFSADLSFDEDAGCWNCARNFKVKRTVAYLPDKSGTWMAQDFTPLAGIVGELAHAFDRWLENASQQDVEQYAPVVP